MSEQIVLGQKEDVRTEFKSAAAVSDPGLISRAAVAMLNAEGGDVWVGIREENGFAVGIESIPDLQGAQRRVWDHLISTIEPTPVPGEIDIALVSVGLNQVLKVSARPGPKRRPYAFVRKGGRFFFMRVGDRVRPMTREEILIPSAAEAHHDEESDLLSARKNVLQAGLPLLWVGIQLVPSQSLDLETSKWEPFFQDPSLTGNRPAGWNFANRYVQSRRAQGQLIHGEPDYREVRLFRTGRIEFSVPLKHLEWMGQQGAFWPYALVEYPVSVFRLAATVYKSLQPPLLSVNTDLSLVRAGDWQLQPYSPNSLGFLEGPPKSLSEASGIDDFLLERPMNFPMDEFLTRPDACAFRLLERVYEAFGYERREMPREVNWQSGCLELKS